LTLLTTLVKLAGVIKTFADKNPKEFWDTRARAGECLPRIYEKLPGRNWPCSSRRVDWRICGFLPATNWRSCAVTGRASIAFGSTINSAFASWRDGDAFDVEITDYH
jgi:hypothetical protein